MFKIKANPTFDATLTITGQGRTQALNVTFRHKTRDEYVEMLKAIGEGKTDPVDALLNVLEKWDADMELTHESLKELVNEQPGADWAILTGYGDALAVAREKN